MLSQLQAIYDVPLPVQNPFVVTFMQPDDGYLLERVTITFNSTYCLGSLTINITSPSGTVSTLTSPVCSIPSNSFSEIKKSYVSVLLKTYSPPL